MFTDEHRRIVWDQIRQHDLQAFTKWLSPELLTTAAAEAGVRIGKGPLYVVNLAWLAAAAALHASRSFADVLTLTLKLLADTEGFAGTPLGKERGNAKRRKGTPRRSKHDPRRRDGTVVSEEAFTKARRVLSLDYWRALFTLLGERFEAAHGQGLRWRGFRLLALDGTSITLPGWKRLATYFGTANNGKGKRAPQARLVMLQFPLARIPYRYELAPNHVGEKTLASRLIEFLLPNDLLLLDRGFWSYGLFWQMQNRQAFFGIRLFKTATLKTLGRLGPKDRLVGRKRPAAIRPARTRAGSRTAP
ncbi:MAG: transposase [Phycisphaerae bacterium]|nr:transposase [Phycisphaerae bacterium]